VLSEKRNLCLRLLKNKGFKDESMTKGGPYAIGTSTTLECNKSPGALQGPIFPAQRMEVSLTRFGVEELVQMRHHRHG
jgi:hypothetical protein